VKAWNRDVEGEFFTIHEFDVNSEDLSEVMKREANRLHQSLRIHGGPLIRLGIFHTGEGDYLLIIIHHLVMDAVSWRVLSEDLHTAYSQQLAGEPLALPQKTTSFQSWGRQLQEFANSPALLAEIPYWHALDRLQDSKTSGR
jgi:surfactin family lipopeptide synthetase A